MSVRVFVAANAREGLTRVRKELGDDAVVLSTRPHPQGVELLASAYGDLAVPAVSEAPDTAGSSRILAELSRLRGLLQNQLAGFAWGAARRGSIVVSALWPSRNKAPGQIRRNPLGGGSFWRRRRCSLLTDRWRVCSSLAPCLRQKLLAANVPVLMKRTTKLRNSPGNAASATNKICPGPRTIRNSVQSA